MKVYPLTIGKYSKTLIHIGAKQLVVLKQIMCWHYMEDKSYGRVGKRCVTNEIR